MYRQGLGDCFLLTFFTGPQPVHVLIDCGTLGSSTGVGLDEVAANIQEATANRLHLLIATHEHKDHVSGFNSQREVFDTIAVDHGWAAWTENPDDPKAVEVKKFANDLVAGLRLAVAATGGRDEPGDKALLAVGPRVREVLGFSGDLPEGDTPLGADFAKTVHTAMTYATTRANEPTAFLCPGQVLEPAWLPGVRVFVLGPPRDKAALGKLGEHDSPELYHLAERMGQDLGQTLAFAGSARSLADYRDTLDPAARDAFDAGMPFDPGFRLELDDERRERDLEAYDDPQEAWRRIDGEWLRGVEDLALQLANATNNTSLALAFELIDDGRVLLFPADAQLGNWLSWQQVEFAVNQADGSTATVRADDLLERTVLYKVGHHASHNATLNEHGLEAMTRRDLVAMIPVDAEVAANKEWEMPAKALYKRLLEKTRGRVLRSDTVWPADHDRPDTVSEADWAKAHQHPDVATDARFIDFALR